MDNRREFLKKAALLSGGAGMMNVLPASIAKALAINPAPGSTFLDAEHIVFLMQENRSFDHTYGTLQGVRGFNDPRAITLPNKNLVWLQTDNEGDTYSPFRFDIKDTKITWMDSLPHAWSDQVDARNNGKYDKWLQAKPSWKDEYKGMPLTLGYYSRQDIPFYYSLADAFTVCDQNFCSSLTGTTPNRLYFWTGTIREKAEAASKAHVWNGDADYDNWVSWKTFPERLEENGVSWKVYQNEISTGIGLEGEEDAWLSNFGDNPLEYVTQYGVKFAEEFIAHLPANAIKLQEEIKKQEAKLQTLAAGSKEAKDTSGYIEYLKKALIRNGEDQKYYTRERFEKLSQFEKNLHNKAFANNKKDPDYRKLTTLKYKDGNVEREMKVPKGDIFQDFRDDVKNNKLPAVSWVVAPQNFSDHPSSAWFGAWYISEAMDILTQNPEVWKKTIFILTYDENDGYFDHVPPFVAPHPGKENTGIVSKGIDTSLEYVANAAQQSSQPQDVRESSIGLGYRVPLVIASPWTRGGWVCSQVFDHTSSLQFLETFLSKKSGKKIQETNISAWRRTVCGDLTSAFRPYNNEAIVKPKFLKRDEFVESIHKAQFKNVPSNYKKLSALEIAAINKNPHKSPYMPAQEKGMRSSCALPYELYASGLVDRSTDSVIVSLTAGKDIFGDKSAGSPFHIYAPGIYNNETSHNRSYAVAAGDTITDSWELSKFKDDNYHLKVYGPNGFYAELAGLKNDPAAEVISGYDQGKLVIKISYHGNNSQIFEITDNAYGLPKKTIDWENGHSKKTSVSTFDLSKSFGWYDFTIRIKGNTKFMRRFAGRIETGKASKTDPVIGKK